MTDETSLHETADGIGVSEPHAKGQLPAVTVAHCQPFQSKLIKISPKATKGCQPKCSVSSFMGWEGSTWEMPVEG